VAVIGIGIDIGQKRDPTAVAVVEVEQRFAEAHYVVRFLERRPLGEPYPVIARRLAEVIGNVRQVVFDPRQRLPVASAPATLNLSVFADATGVGQPIVDLLAEAGETIVPVYFVHGDRRTEEHGRITLGKAWLASRLKSLFQTGRIHLPTTTEALAMKQELLDYEIRVDENANDKYGAFKVGAHDDLVTALGLAVGADLGGREATSYSYLGEDDVDPDDLGPDQWLARHGRYAR
jgi:hypothetical protein